MNRNRRRFIQSTLAGGAGLAAGGLVESAAPGETKPPLRRSMDILVLGGTGFIGPHMVKEALRRGHSISLFNRGRTNDSLFPDLQLFKGDRDGGLDVLKGRTWHAVIDNSGYVPRLVEDSARLLRQATEHYLYVSTISAYRSFAIANSETSPLATIEDETVEEVTGDTYGPLKALCERRVEEIIDADKLTILRPTYICGPGDRTDRFTWWPIRTARGGEMLWPGSRMDKAQIIDVRDFASFTIDCLEQRINGTFNTVTPAGKYTMGDLHDDCVAISASNMKAVWVDKEFVIAQKLDEGRSIPIWSPPEGEYAAIALVNGERAVLAGLQTRPVRETARDTLEWWRSLPNARRAAPNAGLSDDREATLIQLWKEQND